MARKVTKKVKITTIEGLAGMIAYLDRNMNEGFSVIGTRFDRIDAELDQIKRTLDKIDTRLAALELAVFGAAGSGGGRTIGNSILERLSKLEHAVFKK
ncbi:MAG TPA: hypothetical protein VJH69_03265 [Candidatus Paceibacterota bacterium]